MNLNTLANSDLKDKRVLLRLDLNVPVSNGQIQDDTRIQAVLPTINYILESGASLIIMTHFGRPEGEIMEEFKTDILAEALGSALSKKIIKVDGCVEDFVKKQALSLQNGEIMMLENTRFYKEETKNDGDFSKKLADLADLYVNDAFGAAHRAHASTHGVAQFLPSYAGLLMEAEITALSGVMTSPKKPLCLLIGGAKIDTKIGVLEEFLKHADYVLIGGALANTFLASQNYKVGASLFQEDKLETARKFIESAKLANVEVILPSDLMVFDKSNESIQNLKLAELESMNPNMSILDLGAESIENFKEYIEKAGTIIWNGPMGLYEKDGFQKGTLSMVQSISNSQAVSIVGGGDSIDAIKKFGFQESDFSHISTGGGAMLEFLEGKTLQAVEILRKDSKIL